MLTDAQGVPVVGAPISVAASGADNSIDPDTGFTDAPGLFSLSMASTRAEAKMVVARVGEHTAACTVTFGPGQLDISKSLLWATPAAITSNGVNQAFVTFRALDAYGNRIAGEQVVLQASGVSSSLAPVTLWTNAAGEAITSVTATEAGPLTLWSLTSGMPISSAVQVVPPPPSSLWSRLSVGAASVDSDDVSYLPVAVTALDANALAVAGADVRLTSTDSTDVFAPTDGKTDAAGRFV